MDFTSGPYNVTFPAGSTNASFSISITNDSIYESSELVIFEILKDSLPTCAQYKNPYRRITQRAYVYLHQNSQIVKKGAAHAKKSSMKKVVKSKVAAQKRLWWSDNGKIFNNNNSGEFVNGRTFFYSLAVLV